MAKLFKSIRPQLVWEDDEPEREEKIKSAGVDAPLPSDDEELDDADENTRNLDGSAEDMVNKSIKPIYIKRKDGSYTHNIAAEGGAGSAIREEQELVENAMDTLKKIVTQHQASTIRFKDGTTLKVDATTASILLQVHGALNKNNQVKLAQTISKDKAGFAKMADFAFRQGRIGAKSGLQGPSPKAI
jgi:predicted  nucleic acid-binding Zn-ribbon protein